MTRTNVYTDGFNLFYGSLKGSRYKWLDLDALSRHLLPKDEINRIRYFTAKVSAREGDPQLPVRQETYLRALCHPSYGFDTPRCLLRQHGTGLSRPSSGFGTQDCGSGQNRGEGI
jgi:hypothetical protein